MSINVEFTAKNLFLPTNHELHGREHFKNLHWFKQILTVVGAIIGSVIPVFGTCAAFRFCAVWLSNETLDPTAAKAHGVATQNLRADAPNPALIHPPHPPSLYVPEPHSSPSPPLSVAEPTSVATSKPLSPPAALIDDLSDGEVDSDEEDDHKVNYCAIIGYDYDSKTGNVLGDHKKIIGKLYDAQFDLPIRDTNLPRLRESRKADPKALSKIAEKVSSFVKTPNRVGQAVDNGDCFYDSVAQCLRDQGIDKNATVDSVRKCIVDFVKANPSHPQVLKIKKRFDGGHDPDGTFDRYKTQVGKTYSQLEREFGTEWEQKGKAAVDRCNKMVKQINDLRAQIRGLDPDEDADTIWELEGKLEKLVALYQKQQLAIPSPGIPIWGGMYRDDIFICEAYKAKGLPIVIECIETEVDEGQPPQIRQTPDQTGTVLRIIHSPNHFSPVLQNAQ